MQTAFTLIELLVVITIIIVLLALLTPALDKAIYQAKLATCSAKLDAVATSTNMYAMDHKRRYPWRSAVETASDSWFPHLLAGNSLWHIGQFNRSGNIHDDRPELASYLSINKYLNCPMTETVDLEDTPPESTVVSSYEMWFGWNYNGRKGMKKLGDKFEARSERTGIGPVEDRPVFKHSVIASDHWFLQTFAPYPLHESSHPDRQGEAVARYYDGEDPFFVDKPTGPFSTVGTHWNLNDTSADNSFDMNFGISDGSVERITEVSPFPWDERVSYILNEQTENGSFTIVPKSR